MSTLTNAGSSNASSVDVGPDEGEHSYSSSKPLQALPNEFRSALDEFRDNWQRELLCQGDANIKPPQQQEQHQQNNVDVSAVIDIDQQTLAENFFRKAVELEQRGKVYDALPLYRKAVQIVPDIEFKFYEGQKSKQASIVDAKNLKASPAQAGGDDNNATTAFVVDLYEKFQLDLTNDYGGKLLLSSRDASVLTTELHISDLPTEILLYIMRWVVSMQLDMRSLERCATACKGLYLLARDEELWRLACEKVWGVNVGTLSNPVAESPNDIMARELPPLRSFGSWRQMFVERERVIFSGCYISKTTYLRMGENSFQDQYYRPVQLVEYYRYIRFLPEGTVYMMTNADEPSHGVTKLRNLQQLRPDVLCGKYRLYGNTVTIMFKKQQPRIIPTSHQQYARQKRAGSTLNDDALNTTKYCIEFRIMNTPKRRFTQLVWLHYSIVQTRNRIETSTEFDLVQSKYPPLWFSPVRSYHLDADAPLA